MQNAPLPAYLFAGVGRFGSRWTCAHEILCWGVLRRSVENINFLFNWTKLTGSADGYLRKFMILGETPCRVTKVSC
jgi:hypothetical protein